MNAKTSPVDRKAALATYKERKTLAGVYRVRCDATGQCWVGKAPNIETIENRIWFSLKHPGISFVPLRENWNAHGAEAFTFEVLEYVDEESDLARATVLKERLAHWRDHLDAVAI